jgi:hypothetical protein
MQDRGMRWLAAGLLLSTLAVLPYLRGDGNGYYAWLRSPIVDHDLQFGNEFQHGDPAFLRTVYDAQGNLLPGMVTETGHVRDQWSVGPAVVWAPFFLLGSVVAFIGRHLGFSWAADGFSFPYLWFVGWSTALAAAFGLLISATIARRHFEAGPVILATIGIWLASPLPIYQYLLPFWPFGVGVLVAAGLLYAWYRDGWGWRRWLTVGILGGLMYSVHPVGVAWLALPAVSLLGVEAGALRDRIRAGAVLVGGGILGALPQLVGKSMVNGSALDSGYQADWQFLRPSFLRVTLGAEHGLFTWTPILIAAVIGLIFVWRTDRRLGIGLVAVFATLLYIVAAYATPEESSFGNRFFVLFTPGFVIGLSALLQKLWSKKGIVIGVTVALIAWNVMFMFQWAWGLVPKRGAVDWATVARQQFTTAPTEMGRAVRLFFTDRGELIRIVQQRDEDQLMNGTDTSGSR